MPVRDLSVGHIEVQGGGEVLLGRFARLGDDLRITCRGGQEHSVEGYFAAEGAADLVTGGAVVSGRLVQALTRREPEGADRLVGGDRGDSLDGDAGQIDYLAALRARGERAPEAAGPNERIAEIGEYEGVVTVTRADGSTLIAEVGTPLYRDDLIATDAGGSVGVRFTDGMSFSLGRESKLLLDEFAYDPQSGDGGGLLSVLQGGFSFVSGEAAHSGLDALMIETPTMTIGVRGTKVAAQAGAEGETSKIALLAEQDGTVGKIMVSTDAGQTLLEEPNKMVEVTSRFEPPSAQTTISTAELVDTFGVSLSALPAIEIHDVPASPDEPGDGPSDRGAARPAAGAQDKRDTQDNQDTQDKRDTQNKEDSRDGGDAIAEAVGEPVLDRSIAPRLAGAETGAQRKTIDTEALLGRRETSVRDQGDGRAERIDAVVADGASALVGSSAGDAGLARTGGPPDRSGDPDPFGAGDGTENGEAPEPDDGEAPEPDGGEAPEPDGGEAPEPDGGESPEPDGGEAPEPDGGESPEPDGGESPEPDGGESPEPDDGETPEPDGGESPEPDDGETPEPDGGSADQDGNGSGVSARRFDSDTASVTINAPTAAGANVIDFAGRDNYIDLGQGNGVLQPGTGDFTVEAWFHYDGTDGARTIVSKGGTIGADEGYRIHIDDGTLVVQASTKTLFAGADDVAASHIDLSGAGWYHVALVIDQEAGANASSVTGYLNGASSGWTAGHGSIGDNVFTTSGNGIDGTDPFLIGADNNAVIGKTDFFNSQIADVRVWNTARSQAEIKADLGRTLNGNEDGLVANWRLDGLSGGSAENSAVGGPDGTAVGSLTVQSATSFSTAIDTAVQSRVTGIDLDGDTLSFSVSGAAANGNAAIDSDTGAWTYTPDSGFTGTDSFSYQISDGNGGTDTVAISVQVGAVA